MVRWGIFIRGLCTGVHVAKVEYRGRQYSKRRVTVHKTEGGPVELWEVRPGRVRLATLPKLREEALQAIRAAGIEPAPYLEDAPHGSGLRDAVINSHNRPADSIEGIAARIYEHAAHVDGYRELGAIDQAMNAMAELGALVALFDVYLQVSTATSGAGKKGAKQRPATKAKAIKEMADRLLREGKDEHEIGGIIAQRLDVTPQYIARVRKQKRT